MASLVRYGKILRALSHPKRQLEDGHRLLFEIHDMRLSHNDWLLAMYCLLSLRPKHKGLSSTLWRYLRDANEPVKSYIFRFAQDTYFDILYAKTHETKSVSLSKSARREKNPAYKGPVLAVHMETHETMTLVGKEEMIMLGFNAGLVYSIICGTSSPTQYTHKGYTFIRLEEAKS